MLRRNVIFIFALILGFVAQANANNNFFLPGDAFFYAEPNHQWFEDLKTAQKPLIEYQRPRREGGRFCGYAGYNRMRLDNLSPEMRANLLKAYQELRNRYPQRIDIHQSQKMMIKDGEFVPAGPSDDTRVEYNLVSMLIYNKDFDLGNFHPLFRYNETWADAAAAFGHPREHVENDYFLEDAASISDDWRDSALVKPLKYATTNPVVKGKRLANQIISVNCADIQILLFPTSIYEDIAFPRQHFTHQLRSGDRNPERLGGGLFSVQESTDANPAQGGVGGAFYSGGQDVPDVDDAEKTEEVLYFAYRATSEAFEVLVPTKGYWKPKK